MKGSLESCMVLLWVLALVTMAESYAFSPWRVRVFNHMKSGQTLFLHCKSKDDDLGQQYLPVGRQFTWGFRENITPTTLFWCYMRNKNSHVALEVFRADDRRISSYCYVDECVWSVRDDGIYWRRNWEENKFYLQAKWMPGW